LFTDDEVYMDDEEQIKEYVLRQRGLIYRGTAWRPSPLEWYFGQVKYLFQAKLYFSRFFEFTLINSLLCYF